jgi:hypothetical protein
MLVQMLPSADAIGQTDCDGSRAMGARTLVTRVAFILYPCGDTQPRPVQDRKVGKREPGNVWRNGRYVRLSPLAIHRDADFV